MKKFWKKCEKTYQGVTRVKGKQSRPRILSTMPVAIRDEAQ